MSIPAGGRVPLQLAFVVRFTHPNRCFPGSSPCQLQVHQRIHRVSNKGRRFSMPQQSECKLPWSARSSAACRTHWGPTPKARPASFRELAGPSVSSVCSSRLFCLEVQVVISDNLCVVRSGHGCNVRRYRVHCRKPTGDAGRAEWRSRWLRSRFFGWYQRCTLLQLLVLFVLIFSAARSLPIAVASCAVIGAAVGTFDTAGQSLRGEQEALSYEEKRKRFFKQNTSSPPLSSPQ
jgi:hypothetical protein